MNYRNTHTAALNSNTIKTLDIQRGDFVDFKRCNGIVTVLIDSVLNYGIVVGHDVDGIEKQIDGRFAVNNNQQ